MNYQANIWGLKRLGVQYVLSVSAVRLAKGRHIAMNLVCVDQFIDRTRGRVESFFGRGIVGHVQFGDPVEEELQRIVLEVAQGVDADACSRQHIFPFVQPPV